MNLWLNLRIKGTSGYLICTRLDVNFELEFWMWILNLTDFTWAVTDDEEKNACWEMPIEMKWPFPFHLGGIPITSFRAVLLLY